MITHKACIGLLIASAALLPGLAAGAEAAPVRCTFDISAVVPAGQREMVQKRLSLGLDNVLRGGKGSVAEMRLVAAFVRGELVARVSLKYSGGSPKLIATVPVRDVAGLTDAANAQASTKLLWIGQLVAPVAPPPDSKQKERWTVLPLVPQAPPSPIFTMLPRGGIWKLHDKGQSTADHKYVVEKLRGAKSSPKPGDILIPWRPPPRADIILTVVNVEKVRLRDMQIHAQAGSFPVAYAGQLSTRKPSGVTGHSGKVRFSWDRPEPAYLLIARNFVPLAHIVVAPTEAVFENTITIPAKWYPDPKDKDVAVSLDEWLVRKIAEIRKAGEDLKRRTRAADEAIALLRNRKFSEARESIARLDPDDPLRIKIEGMIRLARMTIKMDKLVCKAELFEAVRQYDKAIPLLEEVLALKGLPADKESKLTTRLKSYQAASKQLDARIREPVRLLASLRDKSAVQIVESIEPIEKAVAVLCKARQVSSLDRARKDLGEGLALLHTNYQEVLKKIEKTKETDPLLAKLGKTRERIMSCLKDVSGALQRVTEQLPT